MTKITIINKNILKVKNEGFILKDLKLESSPKIRILSRLVYNPKKQHSP